MPPTQNEKLIDVFQDGCEPGVKELFETHEEALLPISEQLQRYKKRDLYSSHFHRTSCKLLGPRTSVHRIHVLSENPFDISDDIDTESHFATWSEETLLSSRRESKLNLRTEDEITKHEYKNWLSERQKLRSDLNNLGLIVPWLIHKPEKTCLEERVLDKLLQNKKNLLPEADVRSIPGFIRNILKKLSTYMIKNKILLRKLFGNSIATKKISLKQCKEGLTKVKQNIFISVDDIDDIVTFFYHNNENNTSFYSALMHTMEQQELQNNKPSNLLAPFSSEREELKSVSSRSKAAVSTDNELISKASLVSIEDIREKSLTPVMRRRMRDTRVKEFKEAFKSCQDQGLISLRDQLQKSLLHPGDLKKSTSNSDMLVTPTGRLLPKDFWKNKEKFKTLKKRLLRFGKSNMTLDDGPRKVQSYEDLKDLSLDTLFERFNLDNSRQDQFLHLVEATKSEYAIRLAEALHNELLSMQAHETEVSESEDTPQSEDAAIFADSDVQLQQIQRSKKIRKYKNILQSKDAAIFADSDVQLQQIQKSMKIRKNLNTSTTEQSENADNDGLPVQQSQKSKKIRKNFNTSTTQQSQNADNAGFPVQQSQKSKKIPKKAAFAKSSQLENSLPLSETLDHLLSAKEFEEVNTVIDPELGNADILSGIQVQLLKSKSFEKILKNLKPSQLENVVMLADTLKQLLKTNNFQENLNNVDSELSENAAVITALQQLLKSNNFQENLNTAKSSQSENAANLTALQQLLTSSNSKENLNITKSSQSENAANLTTLKQLLTSSNSKENLSTTKSSQSENAANLTTLQQLLTSSNSKENLNTTKSSQSENAANLNALQQLLQSKKFQDNFETLKSPQSQDLNIFAETIHQLLTSKNFQGTLSDVNSPHLENAVMLSEALHKLLDSKKFQIDSNTAGSPIKNNLGNLADLLHQLLPSKDHQEHLNILESLKQVNADQLADALHQLLPSKTHAEILDIIEYLKSESAAISEKQARKSPVAKILSKSKSSKLASGSRSLPKLKFPQPRRPRKIEARHVTSPVAEKDSGVSKKRKNEAAIITLPRLRDVTADGHSVNLSTGRAIIKRKVDCWLSQEEYDKLLSSEEAVVKRVPPMPNAFWPGHLLDKQRLCMSTSGPEDEAIRTNAIFHRVKVLPFNGKRTNPGYDNNELTWPTDGHYVIYGNYDSTKTYQV